jgi:membrane associated rhomboid family serine protease
MPSRRHARTFVLRLLGIGAFIAVLWAVQGLNWATGYRLNPAFGLIPREASGLDGIVGMPLLHGGVGHLMSNTAPLAVMGALLAATATRALAAVNAVIVGAGGVLVWLFASPGVHVGASGLVFGWIGFLLARGAVDRSPVTLSAAALVGVLYGAALWGVLPGKPGISWEAHLFGALAGVAAAVLIRTHVHAPRMSDVERR